MAADFCFNGKSFDVFATHLNTFREPASAMGENGQKPEGNGDSVSLNGNEGGKHNGSGDGKQSPRDVITKEQEDSAVGRHIGDGSTEPPISSSHHPTPKYACRKHDLVVSRYCYDCDSVLCAECALTVHRGHIYEEVALAANRCREAVNERLSHMRLLHDLSRVSLEAVETRKTHILQQTDTATSEINRQFDDMVAALQARREELLDRLAELSVCKLRLLCEQEQALSCVVKSIEELTSRVEGALAESGDEELINMQQQLEALMCQENAKHAQIPRLPVEVPDIVVDIHCLEDVKRICQAGSQVYRSNFSGEGTKTAAVGKEACFSLRSSAPVPQPAAIKAVLVSLADSSVVVPMKVSCHECSTLCQVTYTPKVRGRHHICAEENGKAIAGSPLELFVSIELSLMATEGRNIGAFQYPTALDFSSKDLAFVSQRDTDHIAVRTRHGKKVQDLKNMKFKNCWGISIDSEDNMYVTSPHSISKFGSDGRFIKTVGEKGTQPGEFDNPRGIRVIGKKLYVCDRDNSRIQVFSTGLQLLEVIANKATKWITDIAGSSDGRLYVIGQGVPSIQVFSADHTSSSSIHHKELSYPAGICFNSIRQQLFVVDCDSSGTSVFVFELDGQFVTKMCVKGSSGVCHGVTVDRDGFVYVCDGSKNVIHVL